MTHWLQAAVGFAFALMVCVLGMIVWTVIYPLVWVYEWASPQAGTSQSS